MSAIPPVLDIRDDLDRIRAEADADVADDIEFVEERLRDFEEREGAEATSQAGVVDEIDDRLLSIEERVEGEPRRRAEAARNRIRIYREANTGGADDVGIIESKFRNAEEGDVVPDDVLNEEAELVVTVVNEGRPRDVGLTVTFYDAADAAIDAVNTPAVPVSEGDQRRIDAEVAVPKDAAYYTITATDAGP